MYIRDHRVQRSACHVSTLLRKQIYNVKLLEGYKGRHHGGGCDHRTDAWNGYIPGLRPEAGTVEPGALIQAAVDTLQCAVYSRYHERAAPSRGSAPCRI